MERPSTRRYPCVFRSLISFSQVVGSGRVRADYCDSLDFFVAERNAGWNSKAGGGNWKMQIRTCSVYRIVECGNQIQTRLNSFDLFGLRLFASFRCELRFCNVRGTPKVCDDDVIYLTKLGLFCLVQRYDTSIRIILHGLLLVLSCPVNLLIHYVCSTIDLIFFRFIQFL